MDSGAVTQAHSSIVNRLAGIDKKMKIKTRALQHEVHFIPYPERFSYENEGITGEM
jgi:hypothetical protein